MFAYHVKQTNSDANTLREYLADNTFCDCDQRRDEDFCAECCESLDSKALKCGYLYGWSVDQSMDAAQAVELDKLSACGVV